MRYRFDDDVDPDALIDFAEAWAGLGDSVARQVKDVLDDADSWHEQNPNALRLARERIGGYSSDIDEALDAALEEFNREDEACPTCGNLPGDGAGCNDPDGCGFSNPSLDKETS